VEIAWVESTQFILLFGVGGVFRVRCPRTLIGIMLTEVPE
jgi:hypothetical protein